MNRWTLSIVAGALALTAGAASAATKTQSLEDSAWGTVAKKAKPSHKATKHAHISVSELQPTVSLKAGPTRIQPAKHVAKAAPTHQKPVAVADNQMPGAPVDFGSETEGKAYEKDADDSQAGIAQFLTRVYGEKRGSKPAPGLVSMIQLQPKIDKALNDETLSSDDRDSLRSLVRQRDTALYMLSSSLVVQKKALEAGAYLRFLSKSADSGTPMRDAALQQLAQLGIR